MSEPDAFAFSAEHVKQLTGLSTRQLRYWEDTGFFRPDYVSGKRPTRLYSFRDLVGLYTVARLRKDYRFPLQKLRAIGEYLHRYSTTPWASLGFYVQPASRRFAFREPERADQFQDLRESGQELIAFEMARIADDVKDRVRALRRRRPEQVGQVENRRRVVRNASVIAGTRVPTSAVWSFHAAGYTPDEIVREYPTLTRRDVEAAIEYESARQCKRAAG